MKTFKQYISEALDKPYKYKKAAVVTPSPFDNWEIHRYHFHDDKGAKTHVFISHGKDTKKNTEATIDFSDENHSVAATGKGGIRHFSTIKKIMQNHAKKHPHVKAFEFTAEKDDNREDKGGRIRLYKRLARMAGGHSEDVGNNASRHWIPVNRDKNGD